MSLDEAFAPAEHRFKEQVLSQTWGHLYPEPGRKYPGWILFAHGTFGDITVIDYHFDELEPSPWFYDDLMTFVNGSIDLNKQTEGTIYRFRGTYVRYKNQNHRFSGKVKSVEVRGQNHDESRVRAIR